MISNNNQGNPYHDENGKFTSNGGQTRSQQNPQKPVNSYHDENGKFNGGQGVEEKLSKMGFGPDKKQSNPIFDLSKRLMETANKLYSHKMKEIPDDPEDEEI